MKVDYVKNDSPKAKQAEFFTVGNSLVLTLENPRVQHRIILTQGQWKVLAEIAEARASESNPFIR